MKKNFLSIIIASVTAVSFASCGAADTGSKLGETDSQTEIEVTSEHSESEESSENEETENEIVDYSPKEEIINADYSSGLIQIGNDLFRMGGYYTVNEFIAEYGDRYDVSDFHPDDLYSSHDTATVKSKTDKDIQFTVRYESGEEDYKKQKETKIGDCLVTSYFAIFTKAEYTWTPYAKDGMLYSDVASFVDTLDLVRFDERKPFNTYDCYWEHEQDGTNVITIYALGKEKNLLGVYPVFVYNYYKYTDGDTVGNGLMQLQFQPAAEFREKKGINEWHSAKESE